MDDKGLRLLHPSLGKHLASLNLFREPDGSLHITVADGKGAVSELDQMGKLGATLPIDYVNKLILDAVQTKDVERVREAVVNLEQRTILLYQEALDLLVAIINGSYEENGLPWSDAEAFIKRNAPEHYAKIGV